MLDEKDLQAIAQLMAQQRRDIMQDVKTLLDTEVQTKFNLLAEGQEEILRQFVHHNTDNQTKKDSRRHGRRKSAGIFRCRKAHLFNDTGGNGRHLILGEVAHKVNQPYS